MHCVTTTASGKVCYKGKDCQFAHSADEISISNALRQKLWNTPKAVTTIGAVTIEDDPFGAHTDNNVGLTTEAKGSVDTSPVLGAGVNAVLFIAKETEIIQIELEDSSAMSVSLFETNSAAIVITSKSTEKLPLRVLLVTPAAMSITDLIEKNPAATLIAS